MSAIAGAILGLAAFMLAFAFGIVADRRALVRDAAVALRAAWQRSDFRPETDRAQAVTLLRTYVDQPSSSPRRVSSACGTSSADWARRRASGTTSGTWPSRTGART